MPPDPLGEWHERYSRNGTRLGFKPGESVLRTMRGKSHID